MRSRLVLLGILIAAGCSPVEVRSDYDVTADFSRLRNWGWTPEAPASPSAREPASSQASPFTQQRARAAVEHILTGRGYPKVAPEKADFLVAVHATIERHYEAYSYSYYYGWGYPWGPWGYGPYWDGYGPPAVYWYNMLSIVIDVIEPGPAHRLLWRGIARRKADSSLTPQEQGQEIFESVQEALAQFPPGNPT